MFNMSNKKIKNYFIFFILYSVLGWIYEVFLETVVYGWGFNNRGVLFGPYCPIYGFGALLFIACLSRLMRMKKGKIFNYIKPFIIFVLSMALATALELMTSYLLEFFVGAWPWQTYLNYKINFQGRIALSPSIRFGLGGLLILYVIQPFFYFASRKISIKTKNIIFIIFALIFGLDLFVRLIKFFI